MKTMKQILFGLGLLYLAAVPPAFAVEGLQVRIESTNAVLSWPSDYDSARRFLSNPAIP
jgi:hypothetical protein